MNIGIIGLGVGTIAAYCNQGDVYTFYEINPDVIDISKKYFTFLSSCQEKGGHVESVLGDGRMILAKLQEEQISNKFDILAIDAFVDDSVPTHLLTLEAFELYSYHLRSDGILAFQATNRLYEIARVIASNATTLNLHSYIIDDSFSTWVLVSRQPLSNIQANKTAKSTKPWTDNYSNPFGILLKDVH